MQFDSTNPAASLLSAARFAAQKHCTQRRKGSDQAPYVNHVLGVAALLADVGDVTNLTLLTAALLHDTIEDTHTTREELAAMFGPDVLALVLEVTDDKELPAAERKRVQEEHAAHLSPEAKQLKIADKASNIGEITPTEPPDWTPRRRIEYLDWAERVVAKCRGHNPALEEHFDRVLAERRHLLSEPSHPAHR